MIFTCLALAPDDFRVKTECTSIGVPVACPQDVCDDSGGCEVDFVPLEPVSEGEEEEEERGKEGVEKEDEKFEDMFEARLVIHEALHLPMMTDKTQ